MSESTSHSSENISTSEPSQEIEQIEEVKPKKQDLSPDEPVIITTLKKMDLDRQSIPISQVRGEFGEIRRHIDFTSNLLVTRNPNVTTLYENWRHGADNWPDYPCFGVKAFNSDVFVFETFAEVDKQIDRVASFLVKSGYEVGEHIGIFGKNTPRWVMVAEACNFQNMVSVALYETLGQENLEFVVNHAELRIVFGAVNKLVDLLKMIDEHEYLETVVSLYSSADMEGKVSEQELEGIIAAEGQLKKLAKKKGITVISWDQVQKTGKKYPSDHNPPSPEDLAILMYTSGTTGNPKGVMILHRNLMSAIDAGYLQLGGFQADIDCYLSYLPLAHIFERACMGAVLQNGCRVGFYSGDPRNLTADIGAFKPTILAGVPRVFDKIHEGINARVQSSGGIAKFIFKTAYKEREKAKAKGKKSKSLFDGVAFKKAKKALGGNVRLIVSGGAPLSRETQEFVSTVFDCPVLQGYGLTETCASASMSCPEDKEFVQVGPPTPCAEIMLVSIPDMNYLVTDKPCSRGEVWMRGPSVSAGYYKDPEKTAEDFDDDGWFHSGDVGRWNENGTLSIIDRKKNIFKLAQGEYVAAELLEGLYNQNPITSQFWIYGSSDESYLVAVAVVNETVVRSMDTRTEDLADICQNPDIIGAVLTQCNDIATLHKRAGFERIKKITLYHEEWTTENNLATPTMKLKRPQLREFFQPDIDRMYEEIHEELNVGGHKKKTKKEHEETKQVTRQKSTRKTKVEPEEVQEKKKRRRSKEETAEDEPVKKSRKSSKDQSEVNEKRKKKPVVSEEESS